jgi:hypothetical protein
MKINKISILFLFILLISTITMYATSLLDDFKRKNDRIYVLKEAEPNSISPSIIDLNQDYILFDEDKNGTNEKVPVILISTGYEGIRLKISKTGSAEEYGTIFSCYELRSISKTGLFAWAMCNDSALGHFRLYTNQDGKNYLAWVNSRYIQFCEIKHPKDKLTSVMQYFAEEDSPEIITVPVEEIFGRGPFEGTNALYGAIFIESINVSDDGVIIVKFKGEKKDKIYTLIRNKDGEWADADSKH